MDAAILASDVVKRLWRVVGPSLCLLLIAVFLILSQAIIAIRVANPRRETEVASYELFFQVQRACGLQGRVVTDSTAHPPKPPDPWRLNSPKIAPKQECYKIGGLPEATFSFICYSAILIHMWFYNLVLKFNGFDYEQWIRLNTKPVVPPFFSSRWSFDKDNPDKPRKSRAPKSNPYTRF